MVVRPIAERFWEKVAIAGPDDCWEWQASKQYQGYGRFALGHSTWMAANRVAYALTHGWESLEGPDAYVLHSCDNPGCVNPAHLHLGSKAQNSREMVERGRHVSNLPRVLAARSRA